MSLACCLLSINCPFGEAGWLADCASLCDVDLRQVSRRGEFIWSVRHALSQAKKTATQRQGIRSLLRYASMINAVGNDNYQRQLIVARRKHVRRRGQWFMTVR